jgi:hypothetical protein
MASVYDAHVPRICRDRVWQGEDCTVNKPIDSFQGRPIVSQRAGRHYAECGGNRGAPEAFTLTPGPRKAGTDSNSAKTPNI